MSATDDELREDDCQRCGDDAPHLVIVQANQLKAHRDRRPLCDSCLFELGEWWRQEDKTENSGKGD